MTNSENPDADTDLAALRRIAEEGRDLPLLGGRHFLIWGTILPLAALYHWALMSGHIDLPAWTLTASWFGLTALAAVISNMAGHGQRGRPGTTTLANKVERGVWTAAGVMFATIAVCLLINAALLSENPRAWDHFALLAPITFGVYGLAINASAVAARASWLKPYVFASFALMAVTVLMLENVWLYLVFTAGIAALSLTLGFALLRRERS